MRQLPRRGGRVGTMLTLTRRVVFFLLNFFVDAGFLVGFLCRKETLLNSLIRCSPLCLCYPVDAIARATLTFPVRFRFQQRQGCHKFGFCPIFKPLECHSDGYPLILGFRLGKKGASRVHVRIHLCTCMRVVHTRMLCDGRQQ